MNTAIEKAISNGEFENAIEMLKEVIENEPANVDALNNLAVVFSLLEDNESALRTLNLVFMIDAENEVAKENYESIMQASKS